ncbi:transposase domain protein [Paenibacillus macerans]|uniref:Transposase domain protein n=1 Tax=Paenibacillus macerans TaxID=44252 RepID=A0A090ZL43_PAEMA|nr:hypothetical protein [Paenibacillus macerans]KFN10990.1 transposase domain protein [Paenibacillus macerans]
MDNVKAKTVIRQLISLLPIDVHQRLLFDHYTKKLTTMKAIMLFINAQLKQWSSYGEMEIALRAVAETSAASTVGEYQRLAIIPKTRSDPNGAVGVDVSASGITNTATCLPPGPEREIAHH